MHQAPSLSAIVVVGGCRTRSQRALDALGAQTAAGSIEIIVFDLASPDTPRLVAPSNVSTIYRSYPESMFWSRARAAAVHDASAPVVAFIEDHCFPAPTWAEELIEAHQGPWAAVGYAFTNANPETYLSRAGMINDYGAWVHPARRGRSPNLPGQNISYKRDLLLSFGEQLEILLTPDFNLQWALGRRGLAMYVEPRAVVAHEHFTRLPALMGAHYAYCRLLAGKRAEIQSWTRLKRILYGFGVLPGAPLLATVRLFSSLRGRAWLLPATIRALPVFVPAHLWAAIGESLGYLRGPGNAERDLHRWELDTERSVGT
jgi:hypothetical protein